MIINLDDIKAAELCLARARLRARQEREERAEQRGAFVEFVLDGGSAAETADYPLWTACALMRGVVDKAGGALDVVGHRPYIPPRSAALLHSTDDMFGPSMSGPGAARERPR